MKNLHLENSSGIKEHEVPHLEEANLFIGSVFCGDLPVTHSGKVKNLQGQFRLNFTSLSWLSVIVLSAILNLGFAERPDVEYRPLNKTLSLEPYSFPLSEASYRADKFNTPFLELDYTGFREALAFKESGGDYFVVNSLGYLGKYQFGKSTLETLGIEKWNDFLSNPQLQESVFRANLCRNKWVLRNWIADYEGKVLGNITVTESGLLAAAHLAGPGNVIKYLESMGGIDVSDAYGTTVSEYLKLFVGYNLSGIQAIHYPKFHLF